jgi:hypothetical protein
MGFYMERVRSNILPLSVATTLPEAFEEWSFTENTIDHEEVAETCQLCGQEYLRYQFEIINIFTGSTLWVGSQCILKFGVSVFEDGQRLTQAMAKKKLNRMLNRMRQNSCISALSRLAAREDNQILERALEQYRIRKKLTPKQAFVVFWRLNEHNIDYSPTFFKIDLKRQKYKDDLAEMHSERVRLIWPALTASQRKLAEKLALSPIA